MQFNENMIHAELVTCPSCSTELELDHAESESQKYTCPECGTDVDIEEPPISKATSVMIRKRKIHVSTSDKIDIWFYPIFNIVSGILVLIFHLDHSYIFPIILIGVGVFHAYRASVSDKLTFIPSNEPISHKIAIICTIQEKFKWHLTRGKNGVFLFDKHDDFGTGYREIRLICAHDGYYLNCWVNAYSIGSGVSIINTKEIVAAINELTNKSNTTGNRS